MSGAEYEAVRERASTFIVAPGHEDLSIEHVSVSHSGFSVVEAGPIHDATRPRCGCLVALSAMTARADQSEQRPCRSLLVKLQHFVPPGAAVLLRAVVGSTQRQPLAPFHARSSRTPCSARRSSRRVAESLARSFSRAASTSLVITSCC